MVRLLERRSYLDFLQCRFPANSGNRINSKTCGIVVGRLRCGWGWTAGATDQNTSWTWGIAMHTVCVSLQVVGAVETFSTQLALVGLLSCVSSAMFPIIFLGKELFATKLATETILN